MLSKHTVECMNVFLGTVLVSCLPACPWAVFFTEAVIVKEPNETATDCCSGLSLCTFRDRGLQFHSQRGCIHWASVFMYFVGKSIAACRWPLLRALKCVCQ
jgi:hypothetical protein